MDADQELRLACGDAAESAEPLLVRRVKGGAEQGWGSRAGLLGLRVASAGRSLHVGLQISLDYWWCKNVILRGVEEVCRASWAAAGPFGRVGVRGAPEAAGVGALRCPPAPTPPCLWSEQPEVLASDVCVPPAGG